LGADDSNLVIRDNPSPEKALRFSNLYSRLLTQPVLNEKWAILYVLYLLADSQPSGGPIYRPKSALRTPSLREEQRRIAGEASNPSERPLSDAFGVHGIPRLPTRDGGQRDRQAVEEELGAAYKGDSQIQNVKLKAGLLVDNHTPINPSEVSLLRDLPFTLQGLSSTNLTFSSQTTLALPPTLPPPIISLLNTLAEPSLLYRQLAAFVRSPEGSLVRQSLRAAVGEELRSYLVLVATIETQIRRALTSLDENEPKGGIGKSGVTLKRCVLWTREATMGLRLMSMIAEESKSENLSQLVSTILTIS